MRRAPGDLAPWEVAGLGLLTAVAVAALAVAARQPPVAPLARFGRFAGYGLITALHFLLYIASLSFTTVAHSLALVYTAPLFVTLFAALMLGERIPRQKMLGIPIAVLGVAILAGFEPAMDWRMAVGDLMAIGSAIAFGLYSVAGRGERTRVPLLTYAGTVYGLAAVWLLPAALVTFTGLPELDGALAIAALGIFPLAIGHTLYNASLRRVHPTYVNLVATQEVTGGVLLGAIFLGELPGLVTLIGAALTLLGVGAVLTLGNPRPTRGPVE